MKIYTLTIGIDEENEEVEFIKEEQYKVVNTDIPEISIKPEKKDSFDDRLRKLIRTKFNIIGRA